jgi:glycosyltransferase involved in cell wall biosynthesis
MVVEQCWQSVPGGSATYVLRLLDALSRRDDVRVVGLTARHDGPPPQTAEPRVPLQASALPRPLLYESWRRLRRPRAESLAPGADVVHAPTWAVPGTARPLVVTVHDLAFLDDPGHFTARGAAYFRDALDVVRREARAVVTPSQDTADACVRAGVPAARLTVVPHGVTAPRPAPGAVAELRRRHALDRPYILWCGTLEPRKNVRRLVEAFRALDRPDLDLVLVGPAGWGHGVLPADVASDPRLRLLGHLPEPELHAAYAGAEAFAFPSIREGFGLPVLEAMAYGLPVVTSAGTACAEVAGDAALLVDPLDSAAIRDGLARALGPAAADLRPAALDRASGFTWEAAATAHAEVYRSVR